MNELRIISGLHRGVSLPLDGDTIVIGSSLQADLVLVDTGIADTHIKIESSSKLPPNCWCATVLNKDSWDAKGKPLKQIFTLKHKTHINIGGVWITVVDEEASWPENDAFLGEQPISKTKAKKSGFLGAKFPIYAAAAIGLFVTITHANTLYKNYTQKNDSQRVTQTHQQNEKLLNITQEPKHSETELLIVFKKMLKDRRLKNTTITIDDKKWLLQGELEPNDIQKLNRMVSRFNHQYEHNFEIINQTKTADHSLPFEIVKVVSGPYGHIETHNGDKIFVGNEHEGYRLVGIGKDKISFAGKNKMEIKW